MTPELLGFIAKFTYTILMGGSCLIQWMFTSWYMVFIWRRDINGFAYMTPNAANGVCSFNDCTLVFIILFDIIMSLFYYYLAPPLGELLGIYNILHLEYYMMIFIILNGATMPALQHFKYRRIWHGMIKS